jgi:hypothetical protein
LHEPKGPYKSSQYEHSSSIYSSNYLVSATLRSIFGLKSKPLTAREEWAGKLEDELFLDQMRSDAIELLPDIYK